MNSQLLLDRPQPREFVLCRIPLSDSRSNAPADRWHAVVVLGVSENYKGDVVVHVVGTTSKVSGKSTRVAVRAASPEGQRAGAKKDFEICCEWQREVPLTPEYFGEELSIKGTLHPRLDGAIAGAVQALAKLYRA